MYSSFAATVDQITADEWVHSQGPVRGQNAGYRVAALTAAPARFGRLSSFFDTAKPANTDRKTTRRTHSEADSFGGLAMEFLLNAFAPGLGNVMGGFSILDLADLGDEMRSEFTKNTAPKRDRAGRPLTRTGQMIGPNQVFVKPRRFSFVGYMFS